MFALLTSLLVVAAQASTSCRCFPGDDCWPSEAVWTKFNESIGGQLVKTVPLATPCHEPNYDAAQCTILRDGWEKPEEHYKSSSSIMAGFFTNGTCDPYHPVSKPCTLGNYVAYAVNVTTADHVSKTIKFATKHDIRVVVRNTGHDYNGKSTGAGALGIWTHHLKDISIHDYKDAYYTGKAITMGAGVQGFEAYEAAEKGDVQVVGGECPTVGLAGGYSQGGGHSALSSRYGLGSDQVLEWKVVDGKGKIVTATRDNEYSDLYWALSGGGGGTYGVVLSMTSKAHPATPVSGFNLTFTNDQISQDTFYKAVGRFNTHLPAIVDAGAMAIWMFTNTSFAITPLTGPDIPEAKLLSLIEPFIKDLKELGIKPTTYSEQFSSYLQEFNTMQQEIGVGEAQYGGWLIPRTAVQNSNDRLNAALRQITEDGATFIGVGLNVSQKVIGNVKNSVLPAWRDTLISVTLSTPWKWNAEEEMLSAQKKMTNDYIPKLTAVAPGSGVYMNEADFHQPNYKKYFYGANYQKLDAIKRKYDSNDIFYAVTAVGSDAWKEHADGRLCRVDRNASRCGFGGDL
ncbi:uncharacterized protein N7515_010134 [Penicillium bovifimosum]|uniref:FAD-binding PCMH-type domain-containing protein n=1 Tax=Penicillium bovifimosum TaxID=126998 RepID=A0A9W9GI97_9EURO|nr:uncharacterized protein N7515_010134 [Penicillium bovifimosum]KAJ5120746.1 hypothetical protein N7515_010134 [Penicillium bovifimosum]